MIRYGVQWVENRDGKMGIVPMAVDSFVCSHGLGTYVVVVLPYAKIVCTVRA